MINLKFCPACGAKIVPGDRFCGDCGLDIQTWMASTPNTQTAQRQLVQTPPSMAVNQQPPAPAAQQGGPGFEPGTKQKATAGNTENLGSKSSGNKNALVIMISLLAVLFLAGGGLYWWLSRGNDPGTETSMPSANQNQGIASHGQQQTTPNAALDLTRASTYLAEPGLKCTFYVNYPDGTAGVVERISALAVPNEAVRVSEVEIGIDQGADFGYGFHYVERADGTYYILDQTPTEIFPVLKNNITIGQTWNYQNEFGQITWTILDMGVDLDLGFAVFEDCLLVQEDNRMAEFESITYYAPGRGIVRVIDPSGSTEYYKMTALEQMDLDQAAEMVIKWCPNYCDIKDDRTQSWQ